LLAGTWNGGGEKAASYLHFTAAIAALAGKTVTSAKLKAYNHWSYTCGAEPSSVHKVTSAWAGGSTTTYPGPAFETTALATSTFSYGYSACPTAGWGSWTLPTARVQAWVNGTESFAGLTIRASTTDSTQWKRFRSMNATATQRPYLEIGYDNAPGISSLSTPAANARVESLTPTLWADLVDPAATGTKQYKFEVCGGTKDAPTGCVNSGPSWSTSATWQVPAGTLSWFTDHFWRANVSNGAVSSGWTEPSFFTPTVPQPPVTSHLAGAPEGADVPGVNPQVGNYATTVTDANVSVVGPALQAVRTYNSQDLRFDGAFGAGWSTPWDQRLEQDPDGSGSVVVTLATGRQVRFGQNPDGSYAAPEMQNLTLVYASGVWTLRDPSGYQRLFDGSGRLTSVVDPDGRAQTFTHETSNLAVGQPATGSDACNGDETAAKAANGSVGGGDSDKFCSEDSPQWLQVDLGSSQTVSEIVVRHAEAGGESPDFNTRAFTVKRPPTVRPGPPRRPLRRTRRRSRRTRSRRRRSATPGWTSPPRPRPRMWRPGSTNWRSGAGRA
jgi:YD repeat-containing protein